MPGVLIIREEKHTDKNAVWTQRHTDNISEDGCRTGAMLPPAKGHLGLLEAGKAAHAFP